MKVKFTDKDEMGKAFEALIYESDKGFTGITLDTISISKDQAKLLDSKKIKYQIVL